MKGVIFIDGKAQLPEGAKFDGVLSFIDKSVWLDWVKQKAKSEDWRDRCSVAKDSGTPLDVLNELAEDKDDLVRAMAKKEISRRNRRK